MAFTHSLSTNNYGTAKFIVSANAALGTHTTIASALSDASAGDTIFIRDGTYTENLTLKASVNLAAYQVAQGSLNVTILGNCTATFSGSCSISNLCLQTNAAALLTVSGSSATVVSLVNCYINCTNNTGIIYSSSNASSSVLLWYCNGNLGTTGIGYWTSSSAGQLFVEFSELNNTGLSTTASDVSAALVAVRKCRIDAPVSSSSTGSLQLIQSDIYTAQINVTSAIFNGTGSNQNSTQCVIGSGTATAVTCGAGATTTLYSTVIITSNGTRTSGSGTITIIGSEQVATSYVTGSGTAKPISSSGVLTISGSGTVSTSGSGSTVTITGAAPSLSTAFLATQSTAQNNMTGGTSTTLTINNEVFDVGSNYNNATYTFTAPSTGKYHLDAFITIDQVSVLDFAQLNLVTTSTLYFNAYVANLELISTGTVSLRVSVLALMTAGDTALVKFQSGASALSTADVRTDAGGASGTWFCGWLVG